MPRQPLRIQHFEQIAGELNSSCQPPDSGKTWSVRLQSPARVACGKISHGRSPVCLIVYSVCITSRQPLWLSSAACYVTNHHYIMQWRCWGGELKWQSSLQQVVLTQCPCCVHESLEQRPLGTFEIEGGSGWKANNELSYVKGSMCHSCGQSLLYWVRTGSCGSAFGIFHSQESFPKPTEIKQKLSCSCGRT